jgi:radical SAM superfamily enzyme YgiQ (UPF0313 family)
MNICLITAPTVTEFGLPDEVRSESVRRSACDPQLGVLSLAAVLQQSGHNVRIVDVNHTYMNYACHDGSAAYDFAYVVAQIIVREDAEIYGFGSICSSYPLTIRIAEAVKALRRDSTILFGGPQASVVDIQTLNTFPFIDLILRGEAENSFPILIEELAGLHQLEKVQGLTYRFASCVQRNCNSPVVGDLNSLPFPAYHLSSYLRGTKKAALELGRGCPFACTFCSTNDFFRRNFRLRSPERVLQDMRRIASEYSIRDFDLVHDMFTVNRNRVVEFCEAMIGSREGFTWSCSARTDCIDQELLELMAVSGCVSIFFGVESGSVRIQEVMNKHLDPQRAREVIDTADRLGIHTTVSLITGFPEETWGDFKDTVRMFMYSARHLKSDPQLNILAPLAGTPLYDTSKNKLQLDELCSDVSQQSAGKDEANHRLIETYPEIFPNFYLIPTHFLDRDCILEFREFSLVGIECLRWLLSAIDQGNSIVEFFLDWREYRVRSYPSLRGMELRRYYRQNFRSDFLAFVRKHPRGQTAVVEALLDYETQKVVTFAVMREDRVGGIQLQCDAPLKWDDIVVTSPDARLITLGFNVETLIDSLKNEVLAELQHGTYFYVTREEMPGVSRLHRISDWMASAVRYCDISHTLAEVLQQLEIAEISDEQREDLILQLVKAAHSYGFLRIFRSKDCAVEHSTPTMSAVTSQFPL